MKLYDFKHAPNSRRVRVFLAEKGIDVAIEQVDLRAMQQRSAEFTALNPLQRVPVLLLDDGTALAESIAICRYIELGQPEPSLFGQARTEIATIEMWQRRAELHLLTPILQIFRNSHPSMKMIEVPQMPDWAETNKPRVLECLDVLDSELKTRPFLAGERYSVADITGLVAIDFMKAVELSIPREFEHLNRWYADVRSRPSAQA